MKKRAQWIMAAAALAALLLGPACGAASAQPAVQLHDVAIETLAIRIDETDSEFTVIDSRMDETATAAVLFGMIGATINSASNNAEDDAKEVPLRPAATEVDVDGLILAAIRERLAGRENVTLAETPESATHTLVVEIGDWGLIRRAQRPDTMMRAFLKLNLSIVDARGRIVWGRQTFHSVGQHNAQLADFTPDIFKADMEALATRAGYGVANQLIYR